MAYTTAATGNKSAGATWVGGVKPPDNEDWIVAAGHVLTVDEDSICGQSPAEGGATRAISYGSTTSKVIVAEDVFLGIRGEYTGKGDSTAREQFVMEQGSIVEIDASQATDPTNQNYRFIFGDGNTQRSIIKINGTVAKPCTFRSNASGGNGYFTRAGSSNLGFIDATYCNFERIGDATNPWFNGALAATPSAIYRLRNCIRDGCGITDMTGTPHASATLVVEDCLTKNDAHATRTDQFGPAPATAGGSYQRNDPGKEVSFANCDGWTLDGTVFYGGLAVAGTNAWTSAQDVLFRRGTGSVSGVNQVCGDVTRFYELVDITGANPHGIGPRGAIPSTLRRGFFDYIGTSNVGDMVNCQAAASSRAVTVEECVLLKNASGGQIGKLISILGANNVIVGNHNTICCDGASQQETGVIQYGETYDGVDGMITSGKSNLIIGLVVGGGVMLARFSTSSVQLSNPLDFDYNAFVNPKSGTDGPGYHAYGGTPAKIFSGATAPGPNDITLSADPCVNSSANMATWDTSLGGAGTRANALAEMRKRNERSGYNSAYSFSALHTYMRAQFAVTDGAIKDNGHDGVTRGAGDFLPTPATADTSTGLATVTGFAPTVDISSTTPPTPPSEPAGGGKGRSKPKDWTHEGPRKQRIRQPATAMARPSRFALGGGAVMGSGAANTTCASGALVLSGGEAFADGVHNPSEDLVWAILASL